MNRIIVFGKNLIEGTVKTRLAAETSPSFALSVYKQLLEHTVSTAMKVEKVKVHLYWNSLEAIPVSFANFDHFLQHGNDLGEKMHHAFLEGLALGYEKQLLTGSDCPALQASHFEEGFRLLNEKQTVFGPATDGGYYLVGTRKELPPIFMNRNWSHDKVLQNALADLKKACLSFGLLETLSDIDTLADYNHHFLKKQPIK